MAINPLSMLFPSLNPIDLIQNAADTIVNPQSATDAALNVLPYIQPIQEGITGAGDRRAIDQALEIQQNAIGDVTESQKELLSRMDAINQPLISMGNDQLQALKDGIESGAFGMDESLFQDYQTYVAPQYEPGGVFQNEPRESLVTPEKFTYAQREGLTSPADVNIQQFQRPELAQQGTYNYGGDIEQFDASGSDIAQFDASGRNIQQLNAPNTQSYNKASPDVMQWNQQAPQLARPQATAVQNSYTGSQPITQYTSYNGQASPDLIQINPESSISMISSGNEGRPELYTAENAPEATYYDPTASQYTGTEFSVEDDPGYQRRYQKAMEAVTGAASAEGRRLSGATLTELQDQAAAIASEETQAAYDRWRTDENTNYQRYQDEQDRIQNATNYKTEDEYRRYLDQNDIKGAEADKAVSQWNEDRTFAASQNKEEWLREQASKELGVTLNDQQFNQWLQSDGQKYSQYADTRDWTTSQSNLLADKEWNQYAYEKEYTTDANRYNDTSALDYYNAQLQGNNQQFTQQRTLNQDEIQNYLNNRDYYSAENQRNIDNTLNAYGINTATAQSNREYDLNAFNQNAQVQQENRDYALNAYNTNTATAQNNRDFTYNVYQDQNALDLARYEAQRAGYGQDVDAYLAANEQNFQQKLSTYNVNNQNYTNDRDFAAASQQQQFENLQGVSDRTQDLYTTDRAFNYGVNQDTENANWNQYVYNNDLRQNESAANYGLLTDAYTRQQQEKQNLYGTIGDLVNIGTGAAGNYTNAMSNYYNTIGDLALQSANAAANAQIAKANTGLF